MFEFFKRPPKLEIGQTRIHVDENPFEKNTIIYIVDLSSKYCQYTYRIGGDKYSLTRSFIRREYSKLYINT